MCAARRAHSDFASDQTHRRAGRARRSWPEPDGCGGGFCGRDCNAGRGAALRARFLETVVGVFLQAAELAFELLIAELQLLDHARELPDLGFETVEAQHEVGVGHLRRAIGRRRALAAATEALAAAEDAVEQSGGRSASCACAEKTIGPVAAIATKASRDAVVTRGAKRAMGVLVWLKPLNTIQIPASKL